VLQICDWRRLSAPTHSEDTNHPDLQEDSVTTTQTSTLDAATADRALKAKLATMWALGDYPGVAREVIPTLGPELVAACGITAGQRVLDVAAGSGNAAIPAALAGADVTASDLGDRVEGLTAVTRMLRVDLFPTPEAFRDFFTSHYGPTIATYRYIADDPDKVAALDRDLADLARRFDHGTTSTRMDWEYTLITATRR
jgi:hypothetical protein